MYIPYNSRLEYHKSVFGAVAVSQEVIFRIILPRSFCCTGVRLVIEKDGCGENKLSMQWDCMQGDGEEWWKITYVPPESGLFFYSFEYDTAFGTNGIFCMKDGKGCFAGFGNKWQMTVYEDGFTTPDWLKGGVIYQIFPDRFYCSGEEKKGVPADRIIRSDTGNDPYWVPDENGRVRNNDYFGGDFRGIEKKLDYLESLGITCIYLNPVFEAQSNHRYDTADYEKTDPLLGDEKDFVSLCEAAEKRGIRIILDGVFSHTGDDSRYFNRYGRYGETGAYQSRESEYYSWYKFRNWPDDYEAWWGIRILPEVNEDNPSFEKYITGKNGIAEKWLRLGASGWRLDVADELPDSFLKKFRTAVKGVKEDALILGEVWEDASNKTSYGKRREYLLGRELDSIMNYPFAGAVLDFVREGNAGLFSSRIMQVLENYPKQVTDVLMNHISTHDTVRALTALAGEKCEYRDRQWQSTHSLSDGEYAYAVRLLLCAAALQFTLPGVPSVYYGDEAGMQGYKDPFNRRCFPWGSENAEITERFRLLGKIRRENSVFRDGSFSFLSAVDGCVSYVRENSEEKIRVISNSNPDDITYYVDSDWEGAENLISGEIISGSAVLTRSKETVILKVKK